MKKILYSILFLAGALSVSSCSEMLETQPTDQVPGNTIFQSIEKAQSSINGIYRGFYKAEPGWPEFSKWVHEHGGIPSIFMVADLMGDDHIQLAQGSGWYYYDYGLGVGTDWIHNRGRQYFTWSYLYRLISNCNNILSNTEGMKGESKQIENIQAQAYTVRAFSYFLLAQNFQQTLIGNEEKPGVPIYTESTTNETEGKSRGKLSEVYAQIDSDLAAAIGLFKSSGVAQAHVSHADLYVAQAIKARVSLVENKWAEAYEAATEALKKPQLTRVATVGELGKFNTASLKNVLWGALVPEDQYDSFTDIFCHLDPISGNYGKSAWHTFSQALVDMAGDKDLRKEAWIEKYTEEGWPAYQNKFRYKSGKASADHIYLRAEEMILIAAEAKCRLGSFGEARTLLSELMEKRHGDYKERLANRTDSYSYSSNTNNPPTTLMEEILFQRRWELWGEVGRMFDLQRLKLGYDRGYANTNHVEALAAPAGFSKFILWLPQSEFDGNANISMEDQNP